MDVPRVHCFQRALACAALAALCACAGGGGLTRPVPARSASGELKISLALDASAPGPESRMIVTVTDERNAPVADARVVLTLPKSHMRQILAEPIGAGAYTASMDLPAGSEWVFEVHAVSGNRSGNLEAAEDVN